MDNCQFSTAPLIEVVGAAFRRPRANAVRPYDVIRGCGVGGTGNPSPTRGDERAVMTTSLVTKGKRYEK